MNDVRILIVEDEILIAEDHKDSLLSLGFDKIELAHDKASALNALNNFDPHIILLDIRMEKEKDGLEIGEIISKDSGKPFIYITAHSDVAMVQEIIKTRPAGYITKPVKKSDLFASISIALEKVKSEQIPQTIKIKDGYSFVLIDISSILYIEAEGNYLNIHCENKKHVSRQSLDSIYEELDASLFYKVHRSYIVNISKISRFSKKEILICETLIPVSRNSASDFEKFMSQNSGN